MLTLEEFAEYCECSNADYRLRTVGKNATERKVALKPITEWFDSQDRILYDSASLKSLHARVDAIVDKFSTLVSIYVGC